jgi:hypothetical protein
MTLAGVWRRPTSYRAIRRLRLSSAIAGGGLKANRAWLLPPSYGTDACTVSSTCRVLGTELRPQKKSFARSAVGHFRLRQRAVPPGPLPLRPRKLTSGPSEKLSRWPKPVSCAATNSGGYAARSTRMSISSRSSAKSIGFVRSASAPFSNALRFVSASP